MAGIIVTGLGVPQEKNRVASLKILILKTVAK